MEELAEILGKNVVRPSSMTRTVRVSGSLASHYAPATPLEFCCAELLWQRARELEAGRSAGGRGDMVLARLESAPESGK